MKLGIAVVYVVSEENEGLLDLHLSQIDKCTRVPYTIYAAVNRLLPRFRAKLEANPRVKVCAIPTTDVRDKEEHSYYLERLVREAIDDGASHVATLHVDSFPIRGGWAETLGEKLVDSCVAAMPPKYHFTACLFFRRDFYLDYKPTFLLDDATRLSPEYEDYARRVEHVTDSGYGYGFRVFAEGLSFYPLEESIEASTRKSFSTIHDDMIYHLHSAVLLAGEKVPRIAFLQHPRAVQVLKALVTAFKTVVPNRLRWKVRDSIMVTPAPKVLKAIQDREKADLLADPEGYLNRLRAGRT